MTRAKQKHAAIIQAAKKIFLKQGFSATNMQDVTDLAKVSKRTVYHHFPDKTALFQAVLAEHWERINNASYFLNNDEMPEDALKKFAKNFLSFLYQRETVALFRLMIAESARFPTLCQTLLRQRKAPFTQALIDYLIAQKNMGNLKIKDVELAASQFMGLLKEDQFWPKLLGFIPELNPKRISTLVNSAIDVFLAAYRINK